MKPGNPLCARVIFMAVQSMVLILAGEILLADKRSGDYIGYWASSISEEAFYVPIQRAY